MLYDLCQAQYVVLKAGDDASFSEVSRAMDMTQLQQTRDAAKRDDLAVRTLLDAALTLEKLGEDLNPLLAQLYTTYRSGARSGEVLYEADGEQGGAWVTLVRHAGRVGLL